MIDLHVHLLGHLDREATKEHIRSYLDEAKKRNIIQIGFADHDHYWENLNFHLIREVAGEYPELQVRVGLEVDYREEAEELIKERVNAYPFDYVIGSVHQIGGWFFDFPGEEAKHLMRNPDELYQEYFACVEKAASSGFFQSIGHLDLIKIFKIRPKTDVRKLAVRALEAIKDYGLAVEINTNGRYKPVQEFYPEFKLMQKVHEMEIPITLGSDAHESGTVGRDIPEACELLKSIGVRDVLGFTQRKKEPFLLETVNR